MQINLEKFKKDLDKLLDEGELLYHAMVVEQLSVEERAKHKKELGKKFVDFEKQIPRFSEKYQSWYSEALECIRQILPSRMEDFTSLYKINSKRKEITYENYTIFDYLQGLVVTRSLLKEKVVGPDAAVPKFRQQLKIVESLKRKFESSLFDIRTLVQADLFDSELDAARELNKKGFARGAGALASVVLERHLLVVCENHGLKITNKYPGINDFSQSLKDNNAIEIPTWRFIQHLGDLRNLCDHDKKREPRKEEIEDLINGVEKIIKTIF